MHNQLPGNSETEQQQLVGPGEVGEGEAQEEEGERGNLGACTFKLCSLKKERGYLGAFTFFQFLKLTATTINSREADMLSRFFLRNFLFLSN